MNIHLKHLTQRYSDTVALDNVSFDIQSGEFVTVVGPAAAGKSTLLRVVASRETPMSGAVEFSHLDTETRDAHHVSTTFINPVSFSPLPQDLPTGVALVLLDDLRDHPQVRTRTERRNYVRDLRTRAATFVYATRDGDDALALSDRVVVLRAGRLLQNATPAHVLDAPANEFVAAYFGHPTINLVPAILEKDGQAIQIGNQTVALAGCIAEEFCRDVTVGVRPQHVQLRREPGGWRGRVTARQADGDDAVVGQHLEPQLMRKQNSFFKLPLFLLQPEIDLEDCIVRQPKRGQPTPQGANRPEPGEHRGSFRHSYDCCASRAG